MAKLWIAWDNSFPIVFGNHSADVLDFSTGADETAALNGSAVTEARLCSDAPCFFEVGSTPTVTASSPFLPANTPERIKVLNGHKIRVAAAPE